MGFMDGPETKIRYHELRSKVVLEAFFAMDARDLSMDELNVPSALENLGHIFFLLQLHENAAMIYKDKLHAKN